MIDDPEDVKASLELAKIDEDTLIEQAIKEVCTGIGFTVKYLGKVEFHKSLSNEPSMVDRTAIIQGALRLVAKQTKVVDDSIEISQIALRFLEDTKITTNTEDIQLSVSTEIIVLGRFSSQRPIIARHPLNEVAFAHVDTEYEDLMCFYATRKSNNRRFCYCLQSTMAQHLLAVINLAFNVYQRTQDGQQDVDGSVVKSINRSLSAIQNQAPAGSEFYHLIRISTPVDGSSDKFIHREMKPTSNIIERHLKRLPVNTPSSPTNVYLNVFIDSSTSRRPGSCVPPPMPMSAVHIEFLDDDEEPPQEHFPRRPTLLPAIAEASIDPTFDAPPVLAKSERLKNRMESKKKESIEVIEISEKMQYHSMDLSRRRRAGKDVMDDELGESSPKVVYQAPKPKSREPGKEARKKILNTMRSTFRTKTSHTRNLLKEKLGNLRISKIKQNEDAISIQTADSLRSAYSEMLSQIDDDRSLDSFSSNSSSSSVWSADSGVGPEGYFVFIDATEDPVQRRKRYENLVGPPLGLTPKKFAHLAEYLEEQPWFHGTVPRIVAEARLVKNGEFLVRQSASHPGQFIVTALYRRFAHHICLVNDEGQIRSHNAEFGSVIQLIQFHFGTKLPLFSSTSCVLLLRPVARP